MSAPGERPERFKTVLVHRQTVDDLMDFKNLFYNRNQVSPGSIVEIIGYPLMYKGSGNSKKRAASEASVKGLNESLLAKRPVIVFEDLGRIDTLRASISDDFDGSLYLVPMVPNESGILIPENPGMAWHRLFRLLSMTKTFPNPNNKKPFKVLLRGQELFYLDKDLVTAENASAGIHEFKEKSDWTNPEKSGIQTWPAGKIPVGSLGILARWLNMGNMDVFLSEGSYPGKEVTPKKFASLSKNNPSETPTTPSWVSRRREQFSKKEADYSKSYNPNAGKVSEKERDTRPGLVAH